MGDDFVHPGGRQPGPAAGHAAARSQARSGRYERALQTARELEQLGVFWLEEPLDRYDFDGLKRLCANVDILHRRRREQSRPPRAALADRAGRLRHPPARGDGRRDDERACARSAALGELHHKLVAPHHGGGGLGLVAHLHLACAIPNSTYFEMLMRAAEHDHRRLPVVPRGAGQGERRRRHQLPRAAQAWASSRTPRSSNDTESSVSSVRREWPGLHLARVGQAQRRFDFFLDHLPDRVHQLHESAACA